MNSFLVFAAPKAISRIYVRDYNGWRLAGAREGSGWTWVESRTFVRWNTG